MRDIASDNVLKQQKARAQRIDHDYHAKPHPWRTAMMWLSIVLPVLGAVAVGVMTFSASGVSLYEPGPVSTSHSMFNHRCEDCHLTSNGKFGVVTNEKCLVCHDGPLHNHRQVFNGPDKLKKIIDREKLMGTGTEEVEVEANTARCASCHTEHKGNKALVTMTDNHCTQCHLDLKVNDGGKLLYKSGIGSFMNGHPEWKSLRVEDGDTPGVGKDTTPLKFNHAKHMAPGTKYGPDSTKGARNLKCDDCHRPDDQRKYMQPMTYERDCAECHQLFLDKEIGADKAENIMPHGPTAPIRSLVRSQILSNLAAAKEKIPDQKEVDKLVEDKLTDNLFFVPGKEDPIKTNSCLYCHIQNTKIDSKLVIEPKIPDRWFKHSFFNHQTHRVINCEDCHSQARTSSKTTDVLMPGIQSCQQCHKPGGARTGCNECHLYHDKSHSNQNGTLSIKGLLDGGAKGLMIAPATKAEEKKPDEKKPDEKK